MRARVMNCAKLVAYGVNSPIYIGDNFNVEQNYNSISLNISFISLNFPLLLLENLYHHGSF